MFQEPFNRIMLDQVEIPKFDWNINSGVLVIKPLSTKPHVNLTVKSLLLEEIIEQMLNSQTK